MQILTIQPFKIIDEYKTEFYFPGADINLDLEPEAGCKATMEDILGAKDCKLLSQSDMIALQQLGLSALEGRVVEGIDAQTISNARNLLIQQLHQSFTGKRTTGNRDGVFGERTSSIVRIVSKNVSQFYVHLLCDPYPVKGEFDSTSYFMDALPRNAGRIIKTNDGMYGKNGMPFATEKCDKPGSNFKFWNAARDRIRKSIVDRIGKSDDSLAAFEADITDFMQIDWRDIVYLLRENSTYAISHGEVSRYKNLLRGVDCEFFNFSNGDPLCVGLGEANGPECGISYRKVKRVGK